MLNLFLNFNLIVLINSFCHEMYRRTCLPPQKYIFSLDRHQQSIQSSRDIYKAPFTRPNLINFNPVLNLKIYIKFEFLK